MIPSMLSKLQMETGGRGGGIIGVTYPGPQGIIGAPRCPVIQNCIVLWLNSNMQFKRTCTCTAGVYLANVN